MVSQGSSCPLVERGMGRQGVTGNGTKDGVYFKDTGAAKPPKNPDRRIMR